MAKKQTGLEDLFKKTEARPAGGVDLSDLDRGNIKATGVGLKEGEIAALDAIAESLNLARNALMRFAVRWFLMEYRAGRVDPGEYLEEPPPPKKTLRLPGQ